MSDTPKLAEALAKAQGEMSNATLNKINPHFKSKYADLAAIRDATLPVLSRNGLALTQRTAWRDGALILITRLAHASGEFIEGEYPLPVAVDRPQVMGSAMTYARRYGWTAMCGIAAEEDDDAEAAEQPNRNGNGAAKPEPTPKQQARGAAANMVKAFREGGEADRAALSSNRPSTPDYLIYDHDHNVVMECGNALEFLTELAAMVKRDRTFWPPNAEIVTEIEKKRGKEAVSSSSKATYGDWIGKLRDLVEPTPRNSIVP